MESNEAMLQAVAELRTEYPDPAWERRVRARCHAELARWTVRSRKAEQWAAWRARLVRAAAAAGLMLYLTAVAGDTLRLAGWL